MPPWMMAFGCAALMLAGIASAVEMVSPAAAAPVSEDAYPLGTVAFFNAQSCPTGWQTAPGLSGYTLVPFIPIPSGAEGSTVNGTLGSGGPLLHGHAGLLTAGVILRTNRYGGAIGGGDHSTSKSGTLPVLGSTDNDDSNIPYLQLLVCTKIAYQVQNPPVAVPPGIAALFLLNTCPSQWKPLAASNGRMLVGLPAGGTPGAAFGGPALTSIGANNSHSHAFSGTFNIPSTSVALAECCTGSYGSEGDYPFQGVTTPAIIPFPYAAVSQCMPCAVNDPACTSQ